MGLIAGRVIDTTTSPAASATNIISEGAIIGGANGVRIGGVFGMVQGPIAISKAGTMAYTSGDVGNMSILIGTFGNTSYQATLENAWGHGHTSSAALYVGGATSICSGPPSLTESALTSLKDVYVWGSINNTANYSGGMVGQLADCSISDSISYVDVTATTGSVGGFAARIYRSPATANYITNCSAQGDVTLVGGNYVGGFAATIENAIISKSFFSGSVTASSSIRVGGFAGSILPINTTDIITISDSYVSSSTVAGGSNRVGGFAGSVESVAAPVTITTSYVDIGTFTYTGTLGTDASEFIPLVNTVDYTASYGLLFDQAGASALESSGAAPASSGALGAGGAYSYDFSSGTQSANESVLIVNGWDITNVWEVTGDNLPPTLRAD